MADLCVPNTHARFRVSRIQAGRVLLTMLMIVCVSGNVSLKAQESDNVVHWRFNGSLQAESEHSVNALQSQGGSTSSTGGRFVTAEEIPGVVDGALALNVAPEDVSYLSAAPDAAWDFDDEYTIAAWIHPTAVNGWGRLALRWSSAPNYSFHVAIHDGLASLFHCQEDGEYLSCEGGSVNPNRWHHLVALARVDEANPSQSTLEVYLDGQLVATTPFDGTIRRLTSERLGIGDSVGAPSASSRFRGYLDDLTFWDRALTTEEIKTAYDERAGFLAEYEAELERIEAAARAERFARLQSLGFDSIVFAERSPGRDPSGHYYANFGYSCIDPDYWIHGADGGRLLKLNLRTGELDSLIDDPAGAVRDPQVHYDAQKILFCYRKGGTHNYNLYEINTDGTGLRQLTSGPWDDVEPTYLPDGGIAFCSTRCKRYIGCWLAPSATLHRCDGDGSNIRLLSSGNFTENTPAVLADGRILYTRWEYVNRDPVSFHHLWTMNPDGTRPTAFYGNMHLGGVFIDAKPIPDSDRVLLIASPGHGRNEHAGPVATVTSREGPDVKSAMEYLTQASDFRDPYPVSELEYLVARGNSILYVRADGTSDVLYEGARMLHEPMPIRVREREEIVAPEVDFTASTGTLLLQDVYSGRSMAGVERGSVTHLLVLEDLPKPANFHGGGSQPIGHGVTSTLKRVLGTVPVEPDGSALFEVPASRSIYFAALNSEGRSIKQMRSFVTLQPGETTSCVGCHDSRGESPRNMSGHICDALAREPSRIEPFENVPSVIDFPRDVQPILDRRCIECHDAVTCEGGVVLTGDHGPVFSLSYYELLLHWQVKDTYDDPRHGSGRQPGNDRPYTTYSSASPLMDKIEREHYDVELTDQERLIIRLWIDAGVQYPGTYAAYGTGQIGGCWGNNEPVRVMADAWPDTPAAVDAIERRCGACHPSNQLPRHVTARIPLDSWGDMLSWTRPLSRYSRHRLFNLSQPEESLILLASLSESEGGYAKSLDENVAAAVVPEDRSRPPVPFVHPIVFEDRSDPDFQAVLAHITAASAKLEEIKRFDMPGFLPNEHYVREMKRYGILPAALDVTVTPINVYETDEAYWRSFWHQPIFSDHAAIAQ
jgi:hypothetical protein